MWWRALFYLKAMEEGLLDLDEVRVGRIVFEICQRSEGSGRGQDVTCIEIGWIVGLYLHDRRAPLYSRLSDRSPLCLERL